MVNGLVQKMQIKYVGIFMVFLVLFCGFWGRAWEDKEVIKGIISGFHLISSSSKNSDETLVDVLGKNCRQESIHLKRIFKDLGISISKAPRSTSRKSIQDPALSEDNVWKVLNILDPQIKQRLYRHLSVNYAISVNSGANIGSLSRFQNHPGYKWPTSSPTTDSRRKLAESPSPKPSGSKRPSPKQKFPPTEDSLAIAILVPEASPSLDETADTGSDTAGNHESGGHKIIVIVVVVTAVTTLLLVTILFLCCRKAFAGGSGLDHKDDRPLLSLSMSSGIVTL